MLRRARGIAPNRGADESTPDKAESLSNRLRPGTGACENRASKAPQLSNSFRTRQRKGEDCSKLDRTLQPLHRGTLRTSRNKKRNGLLAQGKLSGSEDSCTEQHVSRNPSRGRLQREVL